MDSEKYSLEFFLSIISEIIQYNLEIFNAIAVFDPIRQFFQKDISQEAKKNPVG